MVRGLWFALLLMGAIGRVAWADDPLAQARASIAESDYAAARPALTAALAAGERNPEEVAEIYRLSGIVAAALGDAKAATDAFTRLLALSPKATLPAGTSPKIKRPFDAAARYWKNRAPLEAKLETAATPPVITLVVVSDPLKMIARVQTVFAVDGGSERRAEAAAAARTEIALPAGRRIDARVFAVDPHGNHLIEIGSKSVPVVIVGDAPPPVAPVVVPPIEPTAASPGEPLPGAPPSRAPRPVMLRWWPYAAAAGVFALGTGYFALAFRSDRNELEAINADAVNHRFDEAKAVEDRARRNLRFASIGAGVAGALAITSGVMFVLTSRDSSETRVTAVPLPGGAAIVLGGRL